MSALQQPFRPAAWANPASLLSSPRRSYATSRSANLFEDADVFLATTLALGLGAPGYTTRDINAWLEGERVSVERLVPQTSKLAATALGGDFSLPVFDIQGAEDFTTPTSLARFFVSLIRAPQKAFISIEGGGHFALHMKSDEFLAALVTRVLPLIKRP